MIGLDETILAYFLSNPRSHLWVVDREHITHYSLPSGAEIEAAARAAYAALIDPSSKPDLTRLADQLLGSWLAASDEVSGSVIVVPSGVLHFVPFEALPVPRSGAALGDLAVTSYAPSVGTLLELRSRPTVVTTTAVLALGDARYGPSFDTARGSSSIGGVRTLGALPHSRAEVERMAKLFPSSRSTILLGERATESALNHAGAGQSVVHLATHGWIDPNETASSARVMGEGDGEDGLLQFREILRLPLAADLVTLSACQSALGEVVTGEGMVGLARAFFFAGTDSVVATLWNVDDAATTDFMASFYDGLRRGLPKAEALRRARVELRSDPRYRHPYFWAPYVLLGRGEDLVDIPRNHRAWVLAGAAALIFAAAVLALRFRR
jgi:CHAT domain-containing protein